MDLPSARCGLSPSLEQLQSCDRGPGEQGRARPDPAGCCRHLPSRVLSPALLAVPAAADLRRGSRGTCHTGRREGAPSACLLSWTGGLWGSRRCPRALRQPCPSHRGRKAQDESAPGSVSSESPRPGPRRPPRCLVLILTWQRREGALRARFSKGTNSVHTGSTFMTLYSRWTLRFNI